MTERILLESQLRQAQKMEAVGQLTGGVAHDFNNILTVIIGMTELLSDELAGNREARADRRRRSTKPRPRGAQLTQRMLAFARKQPLQARNLDLNEVVARAVAMLQRTLGEDIALKSRARGRLVAGARRSVADRGRDPQSRRQCARRDAERRAAGDRDGERACWTRNMRRRMSR